MELQVKLFAMLREAAGRDHVSVTLAAGATGADLRAELQASCPELGRFLAQSRLAASHRFVTDDYRFETAEEVALIPPVSGG